MLSLIKEFKEPLLFLSKFLVLYLVLNFFYGLYVDYYSPMADPVTYWATHNTEFALNTLGYSTESSHDPSRPYVRLNEGSSTILSVYEGCNGINVAIIFIAFIVAFGPLSTDVAWFVPLGLICIHLSNIVRIGLLFYVIKNMPDYVYFTHKYLFTAIIYVGVFVLWYIWVSKVSARAK